MSRTPLGQALQIPKSLLTEHANYIYLHVNIVTWQGFNKK